MISRCENPGNPKFHRYGARGISVSPKWRHDFAAFLADMGPKPSSGHSLDRINNDGNYEPGNCRWATPKQQIQNSSRVRLLTHNGLTLCLTEWAERLGIANSSLRSRLHRCASPERALSQAVQP
jgi:hypothetical protein